MTLIEKLIPLIKAHEGFRQFPYKDTEGILTIGYGFNLDDVGFSEEECAVIMKMRLDKLHDDLLKYDWYKDLNEDRKAAIIDMAYNLGIAGLLKFKKMIAALEQRDFVRAKKEALDSRWAVQVGRRADRIASILLTGFIT